MQKEQVSLPLLPATLSPNGWKTNNIEEANKVIKNARSNESNPGLFSIIPSGQYVFTHPDGMCLSIVFTGLDGVYDCHQDQAKEVRGKRGIKLTKDMLCFIWKNFTFVTILLGNIPNDRPGSGLVAVKSGFRRFKSIEQNGKKNTIYIMDRNDGMNLILKEGF